MNIHIVEDYSKDWLNLNKIENKDRLHMENYYDV